MHGAWQQYLAGPGNVKFPRGKLWRYDQPKWVNQKMWCDDPANPPRASGDDGDGDNHHDGGAAAGGGDGDGGGGGGGDNFQQQADQQVTVMDTYQSCQYIIGDITKSYVLVMPASSSKS